MPDFFIKGQRFTLPQTYHQGHKLALGEAEALNRLLAKTLREAVVSGVIRSRSEAQAFILSDQVFEKLGASENAGVVDLSELEGL